MSTSRRITVSLPPDLVAQVDLVSGRLGTSRSAVLSVVLQESISPLAELVELLPPAGVEPTGAEVRRFRGQSAQVIRDLIEKVRGDYGSASGE